MLDAPVRRFGHGVDAALKEIRPADDAKGRSGPRRVIAPE
jgi:hypothetical protein